MVTFTPSDEDQFHTHTWSSSSDLSLPDGSSPATPNSPRALPDPSARPTGSQEPAPMRSPAPTAAASVPPDSRPHIAPPPPSPGSAVPANPRAFKNAPIRPSTQQVAQPGLPDRETATSQITGSPGLAASARAPRSALKGSKTAQVLPSPSTGPKHVGFRLPDDHPVASKPPTTPLPKLSSSNGTRARTDSRSADANPSPSGLLVRPWALWLSTWALWPAASTPTPGSRTLLDHDPGLNPPRSTIGGWNQHLQDVLRQMQRLILPTEPPQDPSLHHHHRHDHRCRHRHHQYQSPPPSPWLESQPRSRDQLRSARQDMLESRRRALLSADGAIHPADVSSHGRTVVLAAEVEGFRPGLDPPRLRWADYLQRPAKDPFSLMRLVPPPAPYAESPPSLWRKRSPQAAYSAAAAAASLRRRRSGDVDEEYALRQLAAYEARPDRRAYRLPRFGRTRELRPLGTKSSMIEWAAGQGTPLLLLLLAASAVAAIAAATVIIWLLLWLSPARCALRIGAGGHTALMCEYRG